MPMVKQIRIVAFVFFMSCVGIASGADALSLQPEAEGLDKPQDVSIQSSGEEVVIDGYFQDWEVDPSVILIGKDPVVKESLQLPVLDIDSVWYVFRNDTLYLKIQVMGNIEELDGTVSIFLDVDDNQETGFRSKRGYDFVIQGNGDMYHLENGLEWKASYLTNLPVVRGVEDPTQFELAVPGKLFNGFHENFQVYLKFGDQQYGIDSFDEFGPVRLSQKNLLALDVVNGFPNWLLIVIIVCFALFLVIINGIMIVRDAKQSIFH